MRYSYRWLAELVGPLPAEPAELMRALAGIGLLCDGGQPAGDDYVFSLEIPANRGDLLGLRGLARELAALLRLDLPPWPTEGETGQREAAAGPLVRLTAGDACPLYTGCLVSGVRVAPSPPAVASRLEALGVRPVNNAVDVTNLVMLETGQPLHAFDAGRISGDIEVRFARAGEALVTIDGQAWSLGPEVLVIADDEKVLALAGIMGGRDSEVTAATREIFLESAFFTPAVVRAGRKHLGLDSEAAARFERRVDPQAVQPSLWKAAGLLVARAGGCLAGGRVTGAPPPAPPTITFRPERAGQVLGDDVSRQAPDILAALGCRVARAADGSLRVTPPQCRGDLSAEIDLVEEVGRFHGYERIMPVLPRVRLQPFAACPPERRLAGVRDFLVAAGFDEVVSSSLRAPGDAGGACVALQNPLAADQGVLRRSLLPSLRDVAVFNNTRGNRSLRLFEMGEVVLPGDGTPVAAGRLALLVEAPPPPAEEGLFIKSVLLDLARRLGGTGFRTVPFRASFFGNGAALENAAGRFAVFGTLAAAKTHFWMAEVFLPAWPEADRGGRKRFSPLPRFPAVQRDYSFLQPPGVAWEQVAQAVGECSPLVAAVDYLGRYRGGDLPNDCLALALSVSWQSPRRTLSGPEVAAAEKLLLDAVGGLGLVLREKP